MEIDLSYSEERFRTPLALSSGPIVSSTFARVGVVVENRAGQVAQGTGGVFLSDLWAFPASLLTHQEKTLLMKQTMARIRSLLLSAAGEYADPFQWTFGLEEELHVIRQLLQTEWGMEVPVPPLLALVCWSPFDAAIHDGWGKAAGRSCYDMYNETFMNGDLSDYLGEGWQGRYPSGELTPPRQRLRVQHVVSAGDPLTGKSGRTKRAPPDGLPQTLEEWIVKERLTSFKLKLPVQDVERHVQFIGDVYDVAAQTLLALGIRERPCLSLDPNEGFPAPEPLVRLLSMLSERNVAAYEAIAYIEQPTPRDLSAYDYTLHEVSRMKPVIIDESLDDLGNLNSLLRLGWSGVALKTCKGQSHALLAYCWARANRMFVTVQDLTNPGCALVQSANLAARLKLSADSFEFNSRQYVPASCPRERFDYPGLFHVRQGHISLAEMKHRGLY